MKSLITSLVVGFSLVLAASAQDAKTALETQKQKVFVVFYLTKKCVKGIV